MKISTLVTVLAVATSPALCKKKKSTKTTTTSFTTTTSVTTTSATITDVGMTPQQTTALENAIASHRISVVGSPEFQSYELDMIDMAMTMPPASYLSMMSLALQTGTDSAAQAKVSSAMAMLPAADQTYLMGMLSAEASFASELDKSIDGMATTTTITGMLSTITGALDSSKISIPTLVTAAPKNKRGASASATAVDVFANPTMTPEQAMEIDLEIEKYMASLVDTPQFTSFINQMATLNVSASATASVSASAAFDAQMSSYLDLVPTEARSMVSSVGYAEMSIASEVLNAPVSTLTSTVVLNSTSITFTTATPSTSSSTKSKKGKGHSKTKTSKKHGVSVTASASVTARAVEARQGLQDFGLINATAMVEHLKSSAPVKEIFTTGVVAIGLIVAMLLL